MVLLEGSSADGSGVVVAQSSGRLDDWLLAAGTYTIEVTTSSALATGNYAVRAHWAPAFMPLSAVLVDGSTVELVYDLALNATSVPPVGAFEVIVDGSERLISAVSISGQVITLGLASPLLATGDTAVSYTIPTAPGERRIEASSGAVAVSFADRAVVIPPDPPMIAAVESNADGLTAGLAVSWSAVADMSGYELQWRQDGEQYWHSTRIGVQEEFTVSDLVRGALYEVQVRAVKTGGESGHTLYVTDWSAAGSAIAGDWTPPNLRVTAGDRMLVVTWDAVPAATGYDVEYGPAAGVVQPLVAEPRRSGNTWRVEIADLVNGELYRVAVRSVRGASPGGVPPPGADETASAWVTSLAMPGAYLGGEMSTTFRLGVLFERLRGARYRVWWYGACDGDFDLWQRRANTEVWSRVAGFAYRGPTSGPGSYSLTAPDFDYETSSFTSYQRYLRSVEGWRLQVRCPSGSGSPQTATSEPPGVLIGEVAFYNSARHSRVPSNVTLAPRRGGLAVSWGPPVDETARAAASSIIRYQVEWRWTDGGITHTSSTGTSPLARSYTITGLTPGLAYDTRVRAITSTRDGGWSSYTGNPVEIVPLPDPPSITRITPGHQDLTVFWQMADDTNAYEIEWRRDGETTWQTTRTGIREQYTIRGLDTRALYWVRVRGAKTDGGPDGATLYTTDWSTPAAGIVGDWAPPNLRVIPDHQALIVTWDDLPVATGFEVEYWPLGMNDQLAPASAVRGGDGWFARIANLTNDVPYGIAVRSVRRAVLAANVSPSVDETLRSALVTTRARPGGFSVGSVEPGFVTSGATATVSVRLADADGEPLANVQMGAELVSPDCS